MVTEAAIARDARPDRFFDPVQIAQSGHAMLGLEGAEATGTGIVLLWGWLVDPLKEVERLICRINGQFRTVELLDRLDRPDVMQLLAPALPDAGADVGFLALVPAQPEDVTAASGQVVLTMETAAGAASSANRLMFDPARSYEQGVGRRLPIARMRPEAVARVAREVRRPDALRRLQQARPGAVSHRFGPDPQPRLSIVVPITGDLPLSGDKGVLRQTLAYLDMDPESDELEIVLALTDDRLRADVEQAVREAAVAFRVSIVRSAGTVSVGGATRLGLDAATAGAAVLMAEAMVPPSGGWIGAVLAALDERALLIPEAVPRFDGMIHRFDPGAPPGPAGRWTHDAVRERLKQAVRGSGLDRYSPGLLAGRRETLDARVSGEGDGDGFWAGLCAEALRQGAGSFPSGDGFTWVPGARRVDGSAEALLDEYALADWLERMASLKAPSDLAAAA